MIIALAVVMAGGLGVMMGRWMGERRIVQLSPAPVAAWQRGDIFPSLQLLTEWGDSVASDALLAGGGVVLFLDLECPPCVDMARKWNRAVRDDVVAADQVVAITAQVPVAIARFRQEEDLQFNLYQDPAAAFLANGWITSFPVEVIVGDDGAVVSVTDNAHAPVGNDALQSARLGGN
jgi:peroxiredoxin